MKISSVAIPILALALGIVAGLGLAGKLLPRAAQEGSTEWRVAQYRLCLEAGAKDLVSNYKSHASPDGRALDVAMLQLDCAQMHGLPSYTLHDIALFSHAIFSDKLGHFITATPTPEFPPYKPSY